MFGNDSRVTLSKLHTVHRTVRRIVRSVPRVIARRAIDVALRCLCGGPILATVTHAAFVVDECVRS
ncbi:hypothetical protein D7S86_10520 [Pararobbsia silviterrae]|uniref:Uncharacterized protein n=1 Tax=Pararobbsia silviterrae TaxID=1792498 RepID=A0A494Y082_9BURK|nr:hypothetical protein D7S86_10520 [Pararobbsia silviterrae]